MDIDKNDNIAKVEHAKKSVENKPYFDLQMTVEGDGVLGEVSQQIHMDIVPPPVRGEIELMDIKNDKIAMHPHGDGDGDEGEDENKMDEGSDKQQNSNENSYSDSMEFYENWAINKETSFRGLPDDNPTSQ